MKTLAERLIHSVEAIGKTTVRKILPYALAFTTATSGIYGCATSKPSVYDTSKPPVTSADSSQVYGPETPAGFGEVYGPMTPEITKVPEKPKEKPSIENMNIDSVDANYRFQLSMNRMEDGDEKRLIIAQYLLSLKYATPSQLAQIKTINVENPKELARLYGIFHEVFLPADPNRKTYENEFITKTLLDRVKYASSVQRKCFHDTDNRDPSVARPISEMLDAYGRAIIIDGYIDDTPDRASDIEDILGSPRDKPKPTSIKTYDEEIYVRFKNNPRVFRRFVRGPTTNFAWMEPGNTPEAQRAKAEGDMNLVTEDSIPPLSQDDASLYFIPVPDETRTSFRGVSYFLVNPKPFVIKTDSGKFAEIVVNTFVHRPDSSLIVQDSLKHLIPVPPEGFHKDDRIRFSLPTSVVIYNLGDTIKTFQYSAEILTAKKDPEKWDDAGRVFVDVDGPVPVHFGYVVNDEDKIQIPAVGERGGSLTLRGPRQLVSHDRRVSLPIPDSSGNYPLEFIVKAFKPSRPLREESNQSIEKRDSTVLSFWGAEEKVFREMLRTGIVPSTYEAQVLVETQIRRRVNGKNVLVDTSYMETRTYPIPDEQRRLLANYLMPTRSEETAVFTDTLFGSADRTTGENEVTIPLPDSIFKEGEYYHFSVDVNPRNHDRFSPDVVGRKQAIAYQLKVVKNVKIVKKIPGKRNKK
jgi:hypothetical protein